VLLLFPGLRADDQKIENDTDANEGNQHSQWGLLRLRGGIGEK
jgi:hypothetical protein